MNKYHNIKTTIDNITFDSQKEAKRYCELKLLQKVGAIKDLELQPRFEILPAFTANGQKFRKTEYVADFRYIDVQNNGIEVIEDVKSEFTQSLPLYKLKKKLFHFTHQDYVFREV